MIRNSGVHAIYITKIQVTVIIQDNRYKIPINVIITGQVLT